MQVKAIEICQNRMPGEFLGIHIQKQIHFGAQEIIASEEVLIIERGDNKEFSLSLRPGLPFEIRKGGEYKFSLQGKNGFLGHL